MSQIRRGGHGYVQVPADLPDACRWAMDFYIDEPEVWLGQEPESWELNEMRALIGLRAHRTYGNGSISVSGADLAAVRNMLDSALLESSQSCDEYAADDHVAPPPDGEMCMWCNWCALLVCRDRCDYWLDQAKLRRNAYIGPTDSSVEAMWSTLWSGKTYPPNMKTTEPR